MQSQLQLFDSGLSYTECKSKSQDRDFENMKNIQLKGIVQHWINTYQNKETVRSHSERWKLIFKRYMDPNITLAQYCMYNHGVLLEKIASDPVFEDTSKCNYIFSYKSFNTWLREISDIIPTVRVSKFIRRFPSLEKIKTKIITMEEAMEVYNNIRDDHARIFFLLGLESGKRRSEILNLKYEDIDFETNTILYHTNKTNGTHQVRIYHSKAVMDILKKHMGDNRDYVFYGKKKSVGNARISKVCLHMYFKEAGKKAGINFHAHMLRALFITESYKKGKSAYEIAKITGHRRLDQVHAYIKDENWDNFTKDCKVSFFE